MSHFSFSLALVSSVYENVHVAWIKIHILHRVYENVHVAWIKIHILHRVNAFQ